MIGALFIRFQQPGQGMIRIALGAMLALLRVTTGVPERRFKALYRRQLPALPTLRANGIEKARIE